MYWSKLTTKSHFICAICKMAICFCMVVNGCNNSSHNPPLIYGELLSSPDTISSIRARFADYRLEEVIEESSAQRFIVLFLDNKERIELEMNVYYDDFGKVDIIALYADAEGLPAMTKYYNSEDGLYLGIKHDDFIAYVNKYNLKIENKSENEFFKSATIIYDSRMLKAEVQVTFGGNDCIGIAINYK